MEIARYLRCVIALQVTLLVSTPASAQNCSATGGLKYMGNNTSQSQSIWLSTTTPGSFELEAAQRGTVVDQWSLGSDGSHLSYSPFVSEGNGGAHKLYDVSDDNHCLLDTQNQSGDSNLPDLVLPPPIRPVPPIAILPPEGITPGKPVKPSLPIGTLPIDPMPPIGTLPPAGITPGKPVKPELPIGTLPVDPTPPIGTLPPAGITPGKPVKPELPIGTLPVDPTPPIGTLPPAGITPGKPVKPELPIGTLPVDPTPPIGTLPPEGITPGKPVKPELPIGTLPVDPTPPIGTLPPEGITPERPVKPGLPVGKTPIEPAPQGGGGGAGNEGPAGTVQMVGSQIAGSPDGRLVCPEDVNDQAFQALREDPQYRHCWAEDELVQAGGGGGQEAPVTRGRLYEQTAPWNIWLNPKMTKTDDRRYGREVAARSYAVALGGDKRFDSGWVLGLWMNLTDGESDGYHSLVESESSGLAIGPYLSKSISSHWAVSAFFSYGRFENSSRLAILQGDYDSEQYSLLFDVNGFYILAGDAATETRIHPRFSVNYTHTTADSFVLRGPLNGNLDLQVAEADTDYGAMTFSAEVNHTLSFGEKTSTSYPTLVPFLELGITYEFERPNDGKILAADLRYRTPSAWSGLAKAGIRSQIAESVYLEARLGYFGFGQDDYDEWEGDVYISYSF